MPSLQGKRDASTVTPQGESKQPLIDGVLVRRAVTHVDDRGTLTEIYDPAWGLSDQPLVYLYQSTLRPGKVKGWIQHHVQTDRLFVGAGFLRFVLYDDRPESPTYRCINQIYISEQNRGIITIPSYVWHAVHNVGSSEALFMNLPTLPYNHENPDKYRLPLDTDLIPFSFKAGEMGW